MIIKKSLINQRLLYFIDLIRAKTSKGANHSAATLNYATILMSGECQPSPILKTKKQSRKARYE